MRVREGHAASVVEALELESQRDGWLHNAQELERAQCVKMRGQCEVIARDANRPIDLHHGGQDRRSRKMPVNSRELAWKFERECQTVARATELRIRRQRRHAAAGLCCNSD